MCVREREREHQGLVKAAWMEADDRWTGLSKYQRQRCDGWSREKEDF